MASSVSEGHAATADGEGGGLSGAQLDHVFRVLTKHSKLTVGKYEAGQREHGGNCWEKPGMLSHAIDEVSDLTVYLWTLREQMLALADECDEEQPGVAARIRRLVFK